MWAIVPIKQFDFAKSRLAPALDPAERRGLVRAMAEDVLDCLAATPGIERIVVVTREPEVETLARTRGADILLETADGELLAAVAQGAAAAAAAGARGVVIVPGDLPLATPAALLTVLESHRRLQAERPGAPAVTLVPDARHEGTNCLACSPPEVIPFRFGRGSCAAHLAAARDRGIDAQLIEVPDLALDVDSPEDLPALLARTEAGRSVAFLHASGIASRVARAHEEQPATVLANMADRGHLGGKA